MPEYGILSPDQGKGVLPWSWAEERLDRSRNYWLSTVRPDGRPHTVVVWGIWHEGEFYFSTGARSRKARNLSGNGACTVSAEDAREAVIVEGEAALVSDSAVKSRIVPMYEAKYGSGYPEESNVYRVEPKVAFGFIEDEEDFVGTATRWDFAE